MPPPRVKKTTTIATTTRQGPRDNVEDAASGFTMRVGGLRNEECVFLLVADGAGGHDCGEVAASIANTVISSMMAGFLSSFALKEAKGLEDHQVEGAMRRAFRVAHAEIVRRADQRHGGGQMATTAVCAVVRGGAMYVAWCGDSRAYVQGSRGLRLCTRDHSFAQQLVDARELAPELAAHHPLSHVLSRCLGQSGEVQPEVVRVPLSFGDRILLVSDGLTDAIGDYELEAFLRTADMGALSTDEIADRLSATAVDAGSQDNVTVLACDYRPSETARDVPHTTLTDGYLTHLFKLLNATRKESSNASATVHAESVFHGLSGKGDACNELSSMRSSRSCRMPLLRELRAPTGDQLAEERDRRRGS